MSAIDWNRAILYAQLVSTAEAVADTLDDSTKAAVIATLGYRYLATFYANDMATDVDPKLNEDPVSFGFLAISDAGELVVSIRGTATILEWIHDAQFLLMPNPVPGARGFTEDGFTALYKSLRMDKPASATRLIAAVKAQIDSGAARSVTICGHSLGGALTTFMGLDVAINTSCKDPLVYSYASPRTGDPTWVHNYNQAVPRTFRVANRADLVPKLPLPLPIPYDHVDTLEELVPPFGQVDLSILCMHHLTTYLWMMGLQAGVVIPLTAECQPKPIASIA